MANRITIPFEVFDRTTGAMADWSVQLVDLISGSYTDIQCAATLKTFGMIEYSFNDETWEFSIPTLSLSFHDPVHDSNNTSLLNFVSGSYSGTTQTEIYVLIYDGGTLMYEFRMVRENIKWSSIDNVLSIGLQLNVFAGTDFPFRDKTGQYLNPLSISETVGGNPTGNHLYETMMEKSFALIKDGDLSGVVAIDHGWDTVDLLFRGLAETSFRGIDEVYLSDKLRDCLYGNEDSYNIFDTIKTVRDFMQHSCWCFRLIYGITEKKESFVCRDRLMDVTPTDIEDDDIVNIEISKERMPEAFYCPKRETVEERGIAQLYTRSLLRYAMIGEDGQVLNSAYVRTLNPNLWFMGRENLLHKADFLAWNDESTILKPIALVKVPNYDTTPYLEFDDMDTGFGEFMTFFEWLTFLELFYRTRIELRGTNFNMWTVYRFNFKHAYGDAIALRLYPRKIMIDVIRDRTILEGYTSRDQVVEEA